MGIGLGTWYAFAMIHCKGISGLRRNQRCNRMKFTDYFHQTRQRPDRRSIDLEWIRRVVDYPVKEVVQADGRIRRWGAIAEMDGKWLRVVLLPDGETIHNAFFDRRFTP